MKKASLLHCIIFIVALCVPSFALSEVITTDTNSDGTPDAWTYMNGTFVEKQEIDMNYDGKVDSVFLYETTGNVKEEILDTDFDGKMDNWRYYDNGQLRIDQMDSNADGKIDVWVHVLKGKIILIEKDTTGDGKPDTSIEY
jgi:hypothetical protein